MRRTVNNEAADVVIPERSFVARHRDALRFWVPVGVATIVALGLRALIPPYIIWYAPHDDTALVQTAASIMAGDWLGTWGDQIIPHMTMAKVPGYSIFLAAIHPTGLTPPVAAILLYLPGALLLALGTRRHLGIRWAAVLYVVLALNPVLYSLNFSRIYRDQLVIALALVILGLATHLAALLFGGALRRRTIAGIAVETVALGLAFALLLVTRNDVHWVWASTAGMLLVVLLARGRTLTIKRGAALGAIAGVVVGLAMTGPATVRALNEEAYGVALTNDYSKGNLARAVRIWASVEAERSDPRALVDAGQRAAAYEVSPTAAELGTWLESDDLIWVGLACSMQPDGTPCEDYVGYFTWALRDAAVANGVDSPAAMQTYFGRLADEIEAACTSGELTCGARALSPNVPAVSEIPARSALANLVAYINASVLREPNTSTRQQPTDPTDPVELWLSTVNGTETVMAMADTGTQASTIEMTAVQFFLRSVFVMLLLPATVLTVVMLFTRSLWRTTTGRMALVCLAGWGINLTIVAVFYAAVNRNMVSGSPIYIQASQSYLLTGLVLVVALAVARLSDWARPFARHAQEPS